MDPEDLLADVDPIDLLTYTRSVPMPEDFTLTREILPETTIQGVKYRIKRLQRRINAAKFRAFNASAGFGRREVAHSITEGMLPPLGDVFIVDELETILLSIARGADSQDLIDALYDDAERHIQGIRARLELAAGDLLDDGVFEITDENGLTIEADFDVDPKFMPTAANLWHTANATPLSDEQAWSRTLVKDGDGRPGDALGSELIYSFLAKAQEYKEAYFGRGQDTYPTLTPGQVDSVRQTYRLPAIRLYDTEVRVDGVKQRVFPENKLLLLPANKQEFGETQYGITAESLVLSSGGQGNPRIEREDQPGVVVTKVVSSNPVQVGTHGNAVAMPVLYAPDAFVSATVLPAQ